MARTPAVNVTARPKNGKQKKTKGATASLEALQKNKSTARAKYSQGQRTSTSYAGYLQRGRNFLADIVQERCEKEAAEPGWVCPEGIDTDVLRKAFDNPPNKHSVYALELFLVQKCMTEGWGKSTGEGIHGAFAKYWDTM